MTYFRTGVRTIIGAKSFHGPVRDGQGWFRLAMVIRRNLWASLGLGCSFGRGRFIESIQAQLMRCDLIARYWHNGLWSLERLA